MKKKIWIFAVALFVLTLLVVRPKRVELSQIITLPTDASKIEVKCFSCDGEKEAIIESAEELSEIENWIAGMSLTKRTFQEGEAPNDMAGGKAYILTFYSDGDFLANFTYHDQGSHHYVPSEEDWYEVRTPDLPKALTEPFAYEKPQVDLIPMVRVDGRLYLDTGRESDIDGRCGVTDGEITSSVSPKEKPVKDDQSNFGASFSYQFVDEGSLDVQMEGRWYRFEAES